MGSVQVQHRTVSLPTPYCTIWITGPSYPRVFPRFILSHWVDVETTVHGSHARITTLNTLTSLSHGSLDLSMCQSRPLGLIVVLSAWRSHGACHGSGKSRTYHNDCQCKWYRYSLTAIPCLETTVPLLTNEIRIQYSTVRVHWQDSLDTEVTFILFFD